MLILMMIACSQKHIPQKLTTRIGNDFAHTIAHSSDYDLYRWDQELRQEKEMNAVQQAKIQQFLLRSKNYVFGANVRCRLRPDHALVIRKGETTYKILLSKRDRCPKLRFVSPDNKTVISLRPKALKRLQAQLP